MYRQHDIGTPDITKPKILGAPRSPNVRTPKRKRRGNTRCDQIPEPDRKSPLHQQDDKTRYFTACKPSWKANCEPRKGQPPSGTPTCTVSSLYKRRRIDTAGYATRDAKKGGPKRGPDRNIRRRVIRGGELKIPERVTSYPLWNTDNVGLQKARCSVYVHHGSGVHSLLRSSQGPAVDNSIPGGSVRQPETPLSIIHRQRSRTKANQNPNLSPTDSTYPTSISLHPPTSGGRVENSGNSGETKPSRPPHQTSTYEYPWPMENGELHWLDTIQ